MFYISAPSFINWLIQANNMACFTKDYSNTGVYKNGPSYFIWYVFLIKCEQPIPKIALVITFQL